MRGFYKLFHIPFVRNEGYVVLVIAGMKLAIGSIGIVSYWSETILHEGFLNYIVIGAVISVLWWIGTRFKKDHTEFEKSLLRP